MPVPPTGGPPDQEPPSLVLSLPADGAVNQSVDQVSLEFNEQLDARTAAIAVSIIPEFNQPLDVRVRGKNMNIRFPSALRPNTTYILTLDSGLKDVHNVALSQPITVAFATGPTLNHGRLNGRVLLYNDGGAAANIDVYAYESDSTNSVLADASPDYRTQTDSQGSFSLSNLREGQYRVLALQDRNRNRRVDPGEKMAVPPIPVIAADSIGLAVSRPWVLSIIDTIPPSLEAVNPRSEQELELRFSEPIIISDTSVLDWQLIDSTNGTSRAIRNMYRGRDARELVLRHPTLQNTTHILTGYGAVTDSTGNRMVIGSHTFTPSQAPFDSSSQFLGFRPDSLVADINDWFTIWPGIRPQIEFSSPPFSEWIVEVRDSLGTTSSPVLSSVDGITIQLDSPTFELPLDIVVTGRDTTLTRTYVRANTDRQGELSGVVSAGPNSQGMVIVQLIRDDTGGFTYSTVTDESGSFQFTGLPGQTRYLLRAFVDENADGKWNPGQVEPFVSPEPIGWKTVEEIVRARWDTVIADTLKVISE